MKFPQLVPDKICNTYVKIYRTDGLNRDGSPKKTVIFEGKCFYSEKTKQKITAEKQIITLSGEMLFNGDIAPNTDIIEGEAELLSGIWRKIYASEKARNPDGTVNYTRLELI
ncbi:MAG: hypothetical protein K2G83_02475 [Ruminococcus sp.]|nr:hypothetical protein [Ruminococcus sp.]